MSSAVPPDHGEQKFPVETILKEYGHTELSMNELRAMRRDEWARIKFWVDQGSLIEISHFYRAINAEMNARMDSGRVTENVDSSDLDKTYIYPGDPAPEGMKWVLVKDDGEGPVAYVEAS